MKTSIHRMNPTSYRGRISFLVLSVFLLGACDQEKEGDGKNQNQNNNASSAGGGGGSNAAQNSRLPSPAVCTDDSQCTGGGWCLPIGTEKSCGAVVFLSDSVKIDKTLEANEAKTASGSDSYKGKEGADRYCQMLAKNALASSSQEKWHQLLTKVGGDSFKAMLAVDATGASSNSVLVVVDAVPLKSWVKGEDKLFDLTGEIIVSKIGDLWNDQPLLKAISVDKSGNQLNVGPKKVFTASNGKGELAGKDCQGWTAERGSEVLMSGDYSKPDKWIQSSQSECDHVHRLYCIAVKP